MENRQRSYEDLIVWQKSMDLTEAIYKLTEKFPKEEKYGLVSQMRRSAVSIPSNIAEGSRRRSIKDTARFLLIAFGSGSELETQTKLSKRLCFGNKNDYKTVEQLTDEVMRMLNKMTQ